MQKNYISNEKINLQIICEEPILHLLKEEYGNYYEFTNGDKDPAFKIYIYINSKKYEDALKKIQYMTRKGNIMYLKNREEIIIINKCNKEIIMLYKEISDNVVQFIGEMIISIFGIIKEKEGYFHIHAGCVEKDSKGIAIIGERKSGKTTIVNILLQKHFDFISNSHLGIKEINDSIIAIGAPSRMGMRVETLYTSVSEKVRNKIIENTEIKKRFGIDVQDKLYIYKSKKFNIKVNEIEKIYETNLKRKTKLKMIIVPLYIPEAKHITIKELDETEKTDIILKNRRTGAYDTVKYMNDLFESNKNVVPQLKNIPVYKIYQNEKNIKELINFINKKLEEWKMY